MCRFIKFHQIATKLYLINVDLEHALFALTLCVSIGHTKMSVVWKEQIWEAIFAGWRLYDFEGGFRNGLKQNSILLLFHEIFHWNFRLWLLGIVRKKSCENTGAWKLNVPSEIISTHFALSQKLGRLTHSFFYLTKASSVFAKESNIPARLTFEFSTHLFYKERSKEFFITCNVLPFSFTHLALWAR